MVRHGHDVLLTKGLSMIDWNDYKYTMCITLSNGGETEVSSDSLLFLIQLGESGFETKTYTTATIHQNN
jgi:hypothetical protein